MRTAALAALLSFPAGAVAADFPDADAKFDKGLYQESLEAYSVLGETASTEEARVRALYRACESEALLFRYGEAIERLEKAPVPREPLPRARYFLLKAELRRQFLIQYGRGLEEDVVEDGADVFRKTPEELRAGVRKAYWESWKLKKDLASRPVALEAYYLDIDEADREVYPTLLDFAAYRFSGFLLGEEELPVDQPKPEAETFLGRGYGRSPSPGMHPTELAAAVMEEAADTRGKDRGAARELWRISRLLVGFRHPGRVRDFFSREDASLSAIETLKKWRGDFRSATARGEAGYEAASLLYGLSKLAEAAALCEDVGKNEAGTRGAKRCAQLLARIREPSLSLGARPRPPPGDKALTLHAKNLAEVHLRLYATDVEDLREARERAGVARYDGGGLSWGALLSRPDPRITELFLKKRRPIKSWSVEMKPEAPHRLASAEVSLPDAGKGLYLAVASSDEAFAPGESMLQAAVVNVTELLLVGSAGLEGKESEFVFRPDAPGRELTRPGFHFYLLDGRTGAAVPGAELALRHSENHRDWDTARLKTGPEGRAQWQVTAGLRPGARNGFGADPLARHDGSLAYWDSPANLGFGVPAPLRLFAELDRPIYRPGQTARYKITVVERLPRGYRVYRGKSPVRVKIRDANWQEVHSSSAATGAGGSVSGEFVIPEGRLLGRYSLEARVDFSRRDYTANAVFSVEEYKRPEFEAEVEESKSAWRYGDEAKVEGKVRYYFGGAVPDAVLAYKIYREDYRPWFCWWWPVFGGGRTEAASGETRTGPDGAFSFRFTPHPKDRYEQSPWPSRFTVEVEARESGGRTIKAERSFLAGRSARLFKIEPEAAFALDGTLAVKTELVNLDGAPLPGSGEFSLYRLDGTPKDAAPQGSWFNQTSPPLERLYEEVPDGERAASGRLDFDGKTPARAVLSGLTPGVYRFTATAKDPWGGEVRQSVIVLSVDGKSEGQALELPEVALAERKEYAAGETARILLGSRSLDETTHVEVWGGAHLLERRVLKGGGVRLISLPLSAEHKGGVAVRWFGVKDFAPRGGAAFLSVPWKEKELDVVLKHDKAILPGQKVSWSLSVRDAGGRKANGEATVKVFDRSLEYYAKDAAPSFSVLYSGRPGPAAARGSVYDVSGVSLRVEKGVLAEIWKVFREAIREPLPPALRSSRSQLGGRYGVLDFLSRGGAMPGLAMSAMMDGDGGAYPEAAPARRMLAKGAVMEAESVAFAADQKREGGGEPAVQARKDFSESAVFLPHLQVAGGSARVAFTVPERLTAWRVAGKVLTPDAAWGEFSEETATRKELMVRVEIPRFFREGDKSVLKAVVHNESEELFDGSVSLSVLRGDKSAESELGVRGLSRSFRLKPHSLEAFSWEAEAPSVLEDYTIRVVARAGARVDAEERVLPILPSRQRLIESLVVALNGDSSKELILKSLAGDDRSRISETLQFQADPQLALTVLNSLPHLVRYPYECVEQTLNRYVPLAVVSALYGKHPALAKAAANLPKRKTLTPAWDKDDPKRLMRLMESPWIGVSRGRESAWPVVDLFDPKVVAAEKRDAFARLAAARNPDGGFPWFAGGRSDAYITLYVLAGFAEAARWRSPLAPSSKRLSAEGAARYGVRPPREAAAGALGYVMREMPRRLRPEEGDVSLLLYAAYVVTAFPENLAKTELPELGSARKMARAWLDYADKHSKAMTQLGKAYAAYAYGALGERAKSELYLTRAMDGAREDPVAGVYWQPEKMSWLWYNDTVETHAFMLRTLQTLRPKDPRIPGLVQWLIFSRKGTEWKSTKASAAAIYAILDYLKSQDALKRGDSFALSWGGERHSAEVAPEDWLAEPIRWTKRGSEITPAFGSAKIEKTGPGLAFASLTHVYTTKELGEATEGGMLDIRRAFYRRVKTGDGYRLKSVASGDAVSVGDEIEVRLTIKTRAQFEYVHIKDPRGAGFEAETLTSGWRYDKLGRYEEPRDSLTNFFISWLPHGEYVLKYRVRPTTPGEYRIGAAVLQSMYAPEFSAHSSGFTLKVVQ